MRKSLVLAAALAGPAIAQSASSLTFWLPGPENYASGIWYDKATTTFPPVASIVSSGPATTVFALGCPTSTGTPSSMFNGDSYVTCNWATDYATYSIISSTVHVMHVTREVNDFSMWWSCTHDVIATKMTCDLEISGNVNDNTEGPINDAVWNKQPDERGNVFAMATAEVVTAGRFGELECDGSDGSSTAPCNENGTGGKGTMVWGVGSDSVPTQTAAGKQADGSGTAATASRTASGSASTASAGVAGIFGVDGVRLAAMVGGAAVAAW